MPGYCINLPSSDAMTMQHAHARVAIAALIARLSAQAPLAAQESSTASTRPNRPTRAVVMDSGRARTLYVSNRSEDHPIADFDEQIRRKARTDSVYRAHARGNYDF